MPYSTYKEKYELGRLFHLWQPGLDVTTLKSMFHGPMVDFTAFSAGYFHKEMYSEGETTDMTAQSNYERAKQAQQQKTTQPPQKTPGKEPSQAEKAAYVNDITLSGKLGKDPELTSTSTRKGIVKCSFCVFNPNNNDNPNFWVDLIMWDNEEKNREQVETFLGCKKGQNVVAQGRFTYRVYQEKVYLGITCESVK